MRKVAYGPAAGCAEPRRKHKPTQKPNNAAHLHLETEQNREVAAAANQRAPQQNVRGLGPTRIIVGAKIGANRNPVHGQILKIRNHKTRVVDLKLKDWVEYQLVWTPKWLFGR